MSLLTSVRDWMLAQPTASPGCEDIPLADFAQKDWPSSAEKRKFTRESCNNYTQVEPDTLAHEEETLFTEIPHKGKCDSPCSGFQDIFGFIGQKHTVPAAQSQTGDTDSLSFPRTLAVHSPQSASRSLTSNSFSSIHCPCKECNSSNLSSPLKVNTPTAPSNPLKTPSPSNSITAHSSHIINNFPSIHSLLPQSTTPTTSSTPANYRTINPRSRTAAPRSPSAWSPPIPIPSSSPMHTTNHPSTQIQKSSRDIQNICIQSPDLVRVNFPAKERGSSEVETVRRERWRAVCMEVEVVRGHNMLNPIPTLENFINDEAPKSGSKMTFNEKIELFNNNFVLHTGA